MKGAMKRGAFKPPDPDPVMKEKFIYFVKNVFCKQFAQMEAPKFEWLTPEAIREYLDHTPYPEHRKQGLFKEFEELMDPFNPKYAVVRGFMKDEGYDEIKYPRIINPRDDKFKVVAAPVFKKIEVEIYKHPSFLKGVPREQWAEKVCDKFVPGYPTQSNDFSAYEAHAVAWVQECEFLVYEHILGPHKPYFWNWLKKIFLGRQHMVYKYFTVSQPTSRQSGDPQTSDGNGLINLALILFFAWLRDGRSLEYVDGDDSLTQYFGCPFPTIDDFRRLGFTAKPQLHRDFTTASFCGLIFDPHDRIIITDIIKALVKLGYTTRNYKLARPPVLHGLAKVKAYSYIYQYAGCPIVARACVWIIRNTGHIDVRRLLRSPTIDMYTREMILQGMSKYSELAALAMRTPSTNTRLIVEEMYGLDVKTQRSLEKWFDTHAYAPMPSRYIADLVPQVWRDYTDRYVTICAIRDSSDDFPD